MKVLELRGYKSIRALNAFHALMLGLKMLPQYMGESYEDFYSRISEMDAASQEKMIREAALFVELERDELEAMTCFACDPNGVPYTSENLKGLSVDQIFEIIVAVCLKLSQFKIGLVTEEQKKNFQNSPSI